MTQEKSSFTILMVFIMFCLVSCNTNVSNTKLERYMQEADQYVEKELLLSDESGYLLLRDEVSFKKVKDLKVIEYCIEAFSAERNEISGESRVLAGDKQRSFMYDSKLDVLKKTRRGTLYKTKGVYRNQFIKNKNIMKYSRVFYVYNTFLPQKNNISIYFFFIP